MGAVRTGVRSLLGVNSQVSLNVMSSRDLELTYPTSVHHRTRLLPSLDVATKTEF